jgi:hypothetical protein
MRTSRRRGVLGLTAAGYLALTAWTVVYVASDDDYRDNGISRWNTYGAKPITVVAIAATLLVSAVAGFAAMRRPGLSRAVWALALVALALDYVLLASMTN